MCPLVVRDNKKKIANNFARAGARSDFFYYTVLRFPRHRGTRHHIPQFARSCKRGGNIIQLLERRIRRALCQRDVSQSVRILEAGGLQFGLPSRLFTNVSRSVSWAAGVSCFARSDSAPS